VYQNSKYSEKYSAFEDEIKTGKNSKHKNILKI